jgi:DtxR family Mn-dependent transcriptional regulator
MRQERVEEYLGAVYRLRTDPDTPLPLSQLTEYFGFSVVSVHEMIQKLDEESWVTYHPYRGVTLTEDGEITARALLRKHRLWERFLTDILEISWDEAHVIAGRLEHAAPEKVTERLAAFLGEPDSCPHGGPIPPAQRVTAEQCLASLEPNARGRVTRISPETAARLKRVRALGLLPGTRLQIVEPMEEGVDVVVLDDQASIRVPIDDAAAIWVEVL